MKKEIFKRFATFVATASPCFGLIWMRTYAQNSPKQSDPEIASAASDSSQKFRVSKKETQVLKEEDFFNNSYCYKLKSEVSEDK